MAEISALAEARGKPRPHADLVPRARWLLLASAKGGSGKTTTALNLAALAANKGLKVALVDMDSQETATKWHMRRPEEAPRIRLFTIPLEKADRAIQQVDLAEKTDGLDVVIIDTPPSIDEHPIQARLLVERSDFVLVPTTQGLADVESVREWMGFLRREGANAAFVLTRTQRTYGSFQEARSLLLKNGQLCPMDIRQLEDVQSTHKFGVGICEIRRAKGVEDFEGVWDAVCHSMGM